MTGPSSNKGSRDPTTRGLILLGIGLLLVGLVLILFWLLPDRSDPEQVNTGNSVIPAKVEYAAPELALENLEGQKVTLRDYLGKVVLLNNWATWCPPCKEELPAFQEFYSLHKDRGFVLIAVEAGEPAEEVAQFVKDHGLTFPVWLDPQNKSLRIFKNYRLPSSFLIDREGTVRLTWTGMISLENLEKYITPLLEEQHEY